MRTFCLPQSSLVLAIAHMKAWSQKQFLVSFHNRGLIKRNSDIVWPLILLLANGQCYITCWRYIARGLPTHNAHWKSLKGKSSSFTNIESEGESKIKLKCPKKQKARTMYWWPILLTSFLHLNLSACINFMSFHFAKYYRRYFDWQEEYFKSHFLSP